MTGLIVVFSIVLAGVLLVNFVSRKPTEIKALEFCDLHRWEYDHLEEMICGECAYKPRNNQ